MSKDELVDVVEYHTGTFVRMDDHVEELYRVAKTTMERCARVADMVESTAEPGHGKDTAAKIGAQLRAMMRESGR